ncbi:MAG TPA: alpha/beta hydrolase family protein [Tepidisphaeraceae bacterium]|jgi:dienelactone hydrolase
MIRKVVCVVALAAEVVVAGAVPRTLTRLIAPATQPTTPVETLTAQDLPLRVDGAAGDTARWLKAFEIPPRQFDYTLQRVEDDERFTAYRLVFASPVKSPFPENNIVPAEFYIPRHSSGAVPAAIVLDIMYGNAIVPRGLARGLAAQGVAAVYMPMAYYNARRPKGDAHIRWIDEDPARSLEPIRQTVLDIRRARAILASRPEIDPDRIGITGVSLGGIMASLAAGVDGEFWRVCPILAGGDLANMIFHAPETRKVRAKLVDKGFDQQKLEPIMAPVDPLHFAGRIDPARCLMINARRDEVIPNDCTLALWQAIGKPTLLWLPSGHYTAAWYLPTIKQTAIDFLKGEPVQKLEY